MQPLWLQRSGGASRANLPLTRFLVAVSRHRQRHQGRHREFGTTGSRIPLRVALTTMVGDQQQLLLFRRQPGPWRDRQREPAAHPPDSSATQVSAHAPVPAQPRKRRGGQQGPVACNSDDDTQPSPAAALISAQPRQRRKQRQPATKRSAGEGQQAAAVQPGLAQPEAVDQRHVGAPDLERSAAPAPIVEPVQASRGGAKAAVSPPSAVSEPVPRPHHSPRRIRAAAPLLEAPEKEERQPERDFQALEPATPADRCNVNAPYRLTALVRDALGIGARKCNQLAPASADAADVEPPRAVERPPMLLLPAEMQWENRNRASTTVSVLPASEAPANGGPAASCQAPMAQSAEQQPSTALPQPSATELQLTAEAAGKESPSTASDPVQVELLAALRIFEHSDAERRQFHECESLPAALLLRNACGPDLNPRLLSCCPWWAKANAWRNCVSCDYMHLRRQTWVLTARICDKVLPLRRRIDAALDVAPDALVGRRSSRVLGRRGTPGTWAP